MLSNSGRGGGTSSIGKVDLHTKVKDFGVRGGEGGGVDFQLKSRPGSAHVALMRYLGGHSLGRRFKSQTTLLQLTYNNERILRSVGRRL